MNRKWTETQTKRINQSRSKILYDALVKWAISNPLECKKYDVDYSLKNLPDGVFGRLRFGNFLFKHKDLFFNIDFQTQNVLDIQTLIDNYKPEKLRVKQRKYYSIYKDDFTKEFSLYSDNHLKDHDDMIDWFVNVAKIYFI